MLLRYERTLANFVRHGSVLNPLLDRGEGARETHAELRHVQLEGRVCAFELSARAA